MSQQRRPGAATARLEALEEAWGQAVSPRVPPEPQPKDSDMAVSGWAHVSRAEAAKTAKRLEVHEELRALSREFEGLLRRHGKALTEEHETRALRYRIAVLDAEKDHRREKYSRLKARMKKLQRETASRSSRDGVASMGQQLAAQDRIIQALREENLLQQAQLRQERARHGLDSPAAQPSDGEQPTEGVTMFDRTLQQTEQVFQDAIAQELELIAAAPVRNRSQLSAADRPFCDLQTSKSKMVEDELPPVQRDSDGKKLSVEAPQQVLTEWLRGIGLGQYALAFSLEGFDDLSVLLELEPVAVDDLTLATAMRFGHAAKFKIRLTELRALYHKQTAEVADPHADESSVPDIAADLTRTLVRTSIEATNARAGEVTSAVREQLTELGLNKELEPEAEPQPEAGHVGLMLQPDVSGGSIDNAEYPQHLHEGIPPAGFTDRFQQPKPSIVQTDDYNKASDETQLHSLLSSSTVLERSAGASRARRKPSTRRPTKAARPTPMRST